jgi:hypothetical protein
VKKWPVLAVAAAVVYVGGHHVDVAAIGHAGAHHAAAAISGPVTRNANEALANQMAASGYGWRGAQATCLDELWTEESGFSSTAYNASSGATGIPQLLPGAHKIPANWSDPRVQVRWGLIYVHDRYGTPCAAWAFETSHSPNWY